MAGWTGGLRYGLLAWNVAGDPAMVPRSRQPDVVLGVIIAQLGAVAELFVSDQKTQRAVDQVIYIAYRRWTGLSTLVRILLV